MERNDLSFITAYCSAQTSRVTGTSRPPAGPEPTANFSVEFLNRPVMAMYLIYSESHQKIISMSSCYPEPASCNTWVYKVTRELAHLSQDHPTPLSTFKI